MTYRITSSLAWLAIVFATLSTQCPLTHAQDSVQQRIVRLVQPYLDNEVVVGMTIVALHDSQEELLSHRLTSKDKGRAPDADTIYETGSTSNVFTGVLLADAVTPGHVRLDQTAGELLSESVTMPGPYISNRSRKANLPWDSAGRWWAMTTHGCTTVTPAVTSRCSAAWMPNGLVASAGS